MCPVQAFFSRKQQEHETLLAFSHALMCLMEKVKQHAPNCIHNADVLLHDQFVEHVCDCVSVELKQLTYCEPLATLLEVHAEAMRWEQEGMPGGGRGLSHSVPSTYDIQYGVQGEFPFGVLAFYLRG